jgi:hypothetical protein
MVSMFQDFSVKSSGPIDQRGRAQIFETGRNGRDCCRAGEIGEAPGSPTQRVAVPYAACAHVLTNVFDIRQSHNGSSFPR